MFYCQALFQQASSNEVQYELILAQCSLSDMEKGRDKGTFSAKSFENCGKEARRSDFAKDSARFSGF